MKASEQCFFRCRTVHCPVQDTLACVSLRSWGVGGGDVGQRRNLGEQASNLQGEWATYTPRCHSLRRQNSISEREQYRQLRVLDLGVPMES